MHGLIDLDFIKWQASAVGQKNTIKCIHKQSGDELSFKTRTDFHGRNKDKNGGWIGEQNLLRDSPLLWTDYDIIDVVTPEELPNVLHTVKLMVEEAVKSSKVKSYQCFLGEGDSFRVELSTLKKYKGNREGTVKPIHFEAVVDYLKRKYKPEVIYHLENDDAVCMEAYKDKNKVVISRDKDFLGCPINYFDVDKPDQGIIDCRGFGSLHVIEKVSPKGVKTKDVKGSGRMFKYFQVISEDDSDNYKANCCSDTSWGAISAYDALKDCKDDKEAFQAMVNVFKKLYPEPKEVLGWKGVVKIDWLYVMQEMFYMAHIHRWENDFIDVKSVLTKLGVDYETVES